MRPTDRKANLQVDRLVQNNLCDDPQPFPKNPGKDRDVVLHIREDETKCEAVEKSQNIDELKH
jgi:hypothetical protein